MGKKAWITVIGTQKTDEGQEDKIEFSFPRIVTFEATMSPLMGQF